MVTKAILAVLEAKPGLEDEVEAFLKSAKPIVDAEPGTVTWYAIKLDDSHYGIFDTFQDQTGLDLHLHGKIAEVLKAEAPRLFTTAPVLKQYEVIAEK